MRSKGLRYSYYRCVSSTKVADSKCPLRGVSGELLERQVVAQLGTIFKTPEFLRLAAEGSGRTEDEVSEALSDIPAFFGGLFPPERERLLHCLVREVVVRTDGIDIEFRTDGMEELVREVVYGDGQQAR